MSTILAPPEKTALADRQGAGRQRRAWLAPTIVTAAVLVGVYSASPNYRWESQERDSPYAGDFLQEWLGGHILLRGQRERLYDPSYAKELQHDPSVVGFRFPPRQYLPVVYPPFYYLAVSPLALVPLRAAAWIWSALMCAAFAGAVVLVARGIESFRATSSHEWKWWLMPAAALYAPLLESLNSGQKGTLCLLLLTATYALLMRGQPWSAGMIFGLLAFKPQLVLVIGIAMLFKRQWRFVAGGACCGAGLAIVSLFLGAGVCRDYVSFSAGAADYIHTAGYDLHESHCLYGFCHLLFVSPTHAKTATMIAGLLLIGWMAILLKGPFQPGTTRFDRQFSILVIGTVLFSPHLFTYDLTVLLLPMYLLGREAMRTAKVNRRAAAVLVLLGAIYVFAGASPAIALATGVQLTTLLMLGLFACLAESPHNHQVALTPSAAALSGRRGGGAPVGFDSLGR